MSMCDDESLAKLTPEERVAKMKMTKWHLVHLQGYMVGSDEQIETYVRMNGDIEFIVNFYFEHNGWDVKRSRMLSQEFVGVVH